MKPCNRPRPPYLGIARWSLLLTTLLITLWACTSHPLTQPTPDPGQQTDQEITIVPIRHLDLLFMIDNSGSMKPKQDKMKAQFINLIDALRDPNDNSLPDLRIAIIDSDLGSGASGASNRCSKPGGYGDRGHFQMRGAADCGANADAQWLEYTGGKPVNFKGEVSQVFGCLASNVGVSGCGYEHQLASIKWAFYGPDGAAQMNFLRPEAYLGIVILTDEDDCSAPTETLMFEGNNPNESASLRCATRAHRCDGVTMTYPTTSAVSVPYESCHARTDDTCDGSLIDTSGQTTCNPLLDVKQLARDIKRLKGEGPEAEQKLLVAGIYGRPRADESAKKFYAIDKVVDPILTTNGKAVYDYKPICYDPERLPAGSEYDPAAAHLGATGGLRIDAFLNEFNSKNRLAYSICESNFEPAMKGIGDALRDIMQDLCLPYKLIDTSPEPGIQADCRVAYRKPITTTDSRGVPHTTWTEDTTLPPCDSTRTPDCWEVKVGNENGTNDEKATAKRCPAKGSAPSQLVNVVRKPNSDLPDLTKVVMQCLTCPDLPKGMQPDEGCTYK